MKCPNCKDEMEGEQAPMVVAATASSYLKAGRTTKMVRGAHYRCDGCDSEWVWIQKDKLRCIDAADPDVMLRFNTKQGERFERLGSYAQ